MDSLISIRNLSRADVVRLINDASARKAGTKHDDFSGKVLASLFYENSTRTRESTYRAAKRLGMSVIGFSGIEGTSVKKGEPLADTVRMYQGYGADVIVLRHPLEGAARFAADVCEIPVINNGDGSNSHPTQTLLDLMTIVEKHGAIDNVRIALVGDLRYGRTVHSLISGLRLFDHVQLFLVAPQSLQMPAHFVDDFEKTAHTKVTCTTKLHDVIDRVDIIYMTRIQRERFPKGAEGEYEFKKVSAIYRLNAAMLHGKKVGIMHPLPRYKRKLEISLDVDNLPNAWYLTQAQNGMFMREALLVHILSGSTFTWEKKMSVVQDLWKPLPITHGTKKGEHMVYRLDNGTLIDHVRGGNGSAVLQVLTLADDVSYIYARHLRSERHGKKDVIGFTNVELNTEELSKVALVEPHATINIIRNKKVHKKGKVVLPPIIEKLVVCQNPRCITYKDHHEFAPQKFIVESAEPLVLRCHYCSVPVKGAHISLRNSL
jgi:aspartate carbamoyltransferase catalytic subunit